MPSRTTDPRFYAALQQTLSASTGGPTNSSALLRDKNLALQKASSLLGYQNYLAQARAWKAARMGVSLSFESEVQTQTAQALSDTRDLASSALRMTRHMKQAGHLDRLLSSLTAGVQAGGPAQISDLWGHVANDPSSRQAFKDQGLTDELFAAIHDSMSKLDGRLYLKRGKLAVDVTVTGQDQVRTTVFNHSAAGPPSSLHDLLTRGRFERMVDQFSQPGAVPLDAVALDLATGAPSDIEMADLLLAGSVQSVQLMAQHKRKVEDTGLATYAGNDPGTALIITLVVAGFASSILGSYLFGKYCPDIGTSDARFALCSIGCFLIILGFIATGFGGDLFLTLDLVVEGWAVVHYYHGPR